MNIKQNFTDEVFIVTTTFYKNQNELRYRLALNTVKEACSKGYQFLIVDGLPLPEVKKKFESLGAIVYPELEKGMGSARRRIFLLAKERSQSTGAKVILWIEPEKTDFIRFIPQIIKPILEGADIVVPFRTKKSWDSYPSFQVQTEQKGNREIAAFTCEKIWMCFSVRWLIRSRRPI